MNKIKTPLLCSLVLLFGIFQGCSSNYSHSSNLDSIGNTPPISIKSDPAFKDFIKKFKILTLPLTIRTLEIAVDSSRKLNSNDNIFLKSEENDDLYAYGMLPDTIDSYKVIWLEPAEVEVPVLTTFTKRGKMIKKEYLGVGKCGSDCGYSCSEFIIINKDFTIFSGDSIKSTDCDTSGNLKQNTTKKYLLYKTCKIQKNGNFEMSKILKKPII